MAFIRRVRTGSGATAVQIAEYCGGRQRIVRHIGSARTDAELGVLLAQAQELLADPAQGVLDLGVEPTPQVVGLVPPAREPTLFTTGEAVSTGGRDGPAEWWPPTRVSCSTLSQRYSHKWGSMRLGMRCFGTW